ncbi:serine/threonine-protein kinase [Parafrankia discariae]|uniref:hypothetical protein n=1 Tax=Parafrankia discariae TaxID=365528 RepID=UPI000364696C|nr:hypothetical protein [Parafrankia discariae]
MNLPETVALLAIITELDARITVTPDPGDGRPHTAALWARLLADIPLHLADEAVMAHYRSTGPRITPGHIVEYVATVGDALPPTSDAAYRQIRRWLAWRGPTGSPRPHDTDREDGEGREPKVHPLTRRVADTLGLSWMETAPEGVVRAAWRAEYTQAADRSRQQVLSRPGGIDSARRQLAETGPAWEARALPRAADEKPRPADGRKALPAGPPVRLDTEEKRAAVAELRALLGRARPAARGEVRPVGGWRGLAGPIPEPVADGGVPDLERARQINALREWAAAQGEPLPGPNAATA